MAYPRDKQESAAGEEFAASGGPPIRLEDLRREVVGLRCKVPVLGGSRRRYVFLDNAASTPTLRPVLKQVDQFMEWYASVHRGAGYKSLLATRIFDRTREVVLRFLGGDPTRDTVIYGLNTTDVINNLAKRYPVQPGDVVVTSEMEHHSNVLPWRRASVVIPASVDGHGELVLSDLQEKLRRHAGKVRLVAITGAANVTGYLNPVHDIARMAHEVGAEILVDAAQLVAHRRLDMRPHGHPEHLDYVALSAHKIYAPFGTGVLVGPSRFFEQGEPVSVGGGTVSFVTDHTVQWAAPPDKEEPGTPNVVGAVALAAAIRLLERAGMEEVARHEAELTRYTLERMLKIPAVEIYGETDPERSEERLGVIAFNVRGMHHALVAAVLSVEAGVGVRNGCFCAHPYIKRILRCNDESALRYGAQIAEGYRAELPGAVRVSFGIYNNLEDVNRFLAALRKIVRKKWSGEYVMDDHTGEYHCRGFEPVKEEERPF